jgi:alpha-beta hydrolase superfamily lysophospholipase
MRPLDKPCLMTLDGPSIYYHGADIAEGLKPAILYFALSAEMSLYDDPFNQPVLEWAKNGIRVFSWDLPFHAKGMDPHQAMQHWAEEFAHNPLFLNHFIEACQKNIQFLIDLHLVDQASLAVAGLSRGGFIAAHLAAQNPHLKQVLGFAPLTAPQPIEELQSRSLEKFNEIALTKLADRLSDKQVRCYIGNHDIRVGTDACYAFIKTLTEQAFAKGIRSPQAELIIYPSIGHRGHGTPPHIFLDGARWLIDQLLK